MKNDEKATTQRVSLRVSDEVHKYYKNKSKKTGISMSSLMYIALDKQREQEELMKNVPDMLKKMEDLQDDLETYKQKGKETLLP